MCLSCALAGDPSGGSVACSVACGHGAAGAVGPAAGFGAAAARWLPAGTLAMVAAALVVAFRSAA